MEKGKGIVFIEHVVLLVFFQAWKKMDENHKSRSFLLRKLYVHPLQRNFESLSHQITPSRKALVTYLSGVHTETQPPTANQPHQSSPAPALRRTMLQWTMQSMPHAEGRPLGPQGAADWMPPLLLLTLVLRQWPFLFWNCSRSWPKSPCAFRRVPAGFMR